ncbi:conserved hypothetical protein [Ferroglobus placidus DSM 10642]|uniref:BioF2-like acetyltransferase domain-containing protein n=1 Tax=Ferroglobus placidus (strain DSM 10642 / AEDII12DO) TaxID=589924 RepID=D3RZZ3_FERPA|nr:GNAT family N-acetyltransferase [Ferroglobus placidus]ADC66056.1 conserved hypothetical protein [Ferroglobus placidus DSM 10642]
MVELKTVEDGTLWDELVNSSSFATIFHEWKWLKAAEKHSGWKFYPVVCYKGMEPVSLFPVFYKRLKSINLVFSPPPKLAIPYLGPLILNDRNLRSSIVEYNYRRSIKALDEFFRELNADFVRIFTPPGLVDVRPFKWNNYKADPFYSYVIDLNRSSEELWMSIEKKLRQNIKKAKKVGFDIYEGGVRELKKVIELVNLRYSEQNKSSDVNVEYLLEIYNALSEKVKVVVVEFEGEVVTGIIDLAYRDKVSSWIGNPKVTVSGTYPNDLLNWHVIEKAQTSGYKKYEIIGANTERLSEFKVRYNPDLWLYFVVVKKNAKASIASTFYTMFGGKSK